MKSHHSSGSVEPFELKSTGIHEYTSNIPIGCSGNKDVLDIASNLPTNNSNWNTLSSPPKVPALKYKKNGHQAALNFLKGISLDGVHVEHPFKNTLQQDKPDDICAHLLDSSQKIRNPNSGDHIIVATKHESNMNQTINEDNIPPVKAPEKKNLDVTIEGYSLFDNHQDKMTLEANLTRNHLQGNRLVLCDFHGSLLSVTSTIALDRNSNSHSTNGNSFTRGATHSGVSNRDSIWPLYVKRFQRGSVSYKSLLCPSSHSVILNKTAHEFILSKSKIYAHFFEDSNFSPLHHAKSSQEMSETYEYGDNNDAIGYDKCLITYDPNFLDIDIERPEKYKITINLPCHRASIISFHDSKKVKSKENQSFIERHPWLTTDITLSKIRSTKKKLSQAAILNSLDMACTALALVYFERLILKNLISKSNYRIFGAACLLLAAKFYGHKNNSFGSLLKELEKKLSITTKEILSNEFNVYKELGFSLLVETNQVIPHFIKLQNSQDYLDLEFAVQQKGQEPQSLQNS